MGEHEMKTTKWKDKLFKADKSTEKSEDKSDLLQAIQETADHVADLNLQDLQAKAYYLQVKMDEIKLDVDPFWYNQQKLGPTKSFTDAMGQQLQAIKQQEFEQSGAYIAAMAEKQKYYQQQAIKAETQGLYQDGSNLLYSIPTQYTTGTVSAGTSYTFSSSDMTWADTSGIPAAVPTNSPSTTPTKPAPATMEELYAGSSFDPASENYQKPSGKIVGKHGKGKPKITGTILGNLLSQQAAGDGKATSYYTEYKWKGINVTPEEFNKLMQKANNPDLKDLPTDSGIFMHKGKE